MYFLYNNRFVEYDGNKDETKENFQSNYERLFNLQKCGESFYFQDENKKQVFRFSNNKTQLIKKLDQDHKLTSNLCHNNVMYYTNTDNVDLTNYNQRKDYLIASTDNTHKDIELDHLFYSDFIYSHTAISEIAGFDNKILLKYNNQNIQDQSILLIDIDKITLSTTDIDNKENKKSSINFYPNPVNDFISININDNSKINKISIYNSMGLKISSIEKIENNKIDISKLIRGIYFLKVETNNLTETIKIIKK
jgi:hypothetical protein